MTTEEPDLEPERTATGRPKRKVAGWQREVVSVGQCVCGKTVTDEEKETDEAVECNQNGCEHGWVSLDN
jgi:hypothetical protein